MTEWGSLSLVDDGEGDIAGKSISLPGVRSGDLSSRHWKPQVIVSAVQFCPTGNFIRSLEYPYGGVRGLKLPIESSKFIRIVCLHKNTVQALLLYSLNLIFSTVKQKCTLI